LPKEIFLAVGDSRKIAIRFRAYWQRRGDLLKYLRLKSSDGIKFVQAPVVTKSEGEEFVKTLLTPSRLQRRKERVVKQAAQKLTAEPVELAFYASVYPNFFFDDWIPDSLENICQVLCPAAANEVLEMEHGAKTRGMEVKVDLSKEVNRFVGWAISNLIKKTRKQFNRSKGPPKKT
jgi:hypothetical protein